MSEILDPNDLAPSPPADDALSLLLKETKAKRNAREKQLLITRLAAFELDDTRTRVAYILNQYPTCRNSDTELVIAYWRHFNGEHLNRNSIDFDALRKVTPFPSIVRARATIQNTFGLFVADEGVRGKRNERENDVRRRQRAAARVGTPFVYIYSDESGKTDRNYIVGSVWINDVDMQVYTLQRQLVAWRKEREWKGEVHFTGISNQRKNDYIEFFRQAMLSSDYIGFKATVLARDDVKKRPTEDAIYNLYYRLVVEGLRQEVNSSRLELPRNIAIQKDQDEGSDKIHLMNLRDKLRVECPQQFDNEVDIVAVDALESSTNVLMQLADLFTGSVNRVLNRAPEASRNHKDEVAEAVLSMLGIDPADLTADVERDFARIIRL